MKLSKRILLFKTLTYNFCETKEQASKWKKEAIKLIKSDNQMSDKVIALLDKIESKAGKNWQTFNYPTIPQYMPF